MNFVNKLFSGCRVTDHQSWMYEKVPFSIIQKPDGSWTFQTKTYWEGFYFIINKCLFIKILLSALAWKDLLPNDGLIKLLAQKFWFEKLVCWCIFSAFAISVYSVCPGSRATFGQKWHATFLNFINWEV